MMKRTRLSFLAAALGVIHLGAMTAVAGSTYEIDPEHSAILFRIKNRDISYVYGRFGKLSGAIDVDRVRDPSRFQFTIEIESRSIDTNSQKRDRHLTGNEFFNTRKHPKIRFASKQCKGLEEGNYEITGELEMMGVKKEITLVFHLVGVRALSNTEYRMGGESTFTLKRSEVGLGAMIPDIADEVTVMVNIEGTFKMVPAG